MSKSTPVAAAVVVAAAGEEAAAVPARGEVAVDSRRRLRRRGLVQRPGRVPQPRGLVPQLPGRVPQGRLLGLRRVLVPQGARLVLGRQPVMSRGLVPRLAR